MKGSEFLKQLQRQVGVTSQVQLARVLGMQQPQISAMRKADISPLTMARIVANLRTQVLDGAKLVPALKRKLGTTKDSEAASALGITPAGLANWKNQSVGISQTQFCNAIAAAREKARSDAHATAYRPIIEMFPITTSRKAVNADVFADDGKNKQRTGLKAELLGTHGIYIFYDARGRALYVGQAKKQSIWKEMNDTYNRNRRAQTVSLVKHPTNNVEYTAAHEKLRQPIDTIRKLVDIAAYFSAYEVSAELIDDFEALFIRAFPNDLLNYKLEKPGKAAAAAKKARRKKVPKAARAKSR